LLRIQKENFYLSRIRRANVHRPAPSPERGPDETRGARLATRNHWDYEQKLTDLRGHR